MWFTVLFETPVFLLELYDLLLVLLDDDFHFLGDVLDEFLHISLVFGKDLVRVTVVVNILDALEHSGDGL